MDTLTSEVSTNTRPTHQMSLIEVLISPLRLLIKNPALLVPSLVDIGLKWLLMLLFSVFIVAYASGFLFSLIKADLGLPWIQWLIGPGIAVVGLAVTQFLVTTFTSGWTYSMFDEIDNRGKISIQNSFAIVRQQFAALIRYTFLLSFLTSLLIGGVGGIIYVTIASGLNVMVAIFLGTILISIIFMILLGWVYGGPAIIRHKCGAIAGMSASWRFVWSGNFWRTIAIHLIAFVGAGVLTLIVSAADLSFVATSFVFPLWLPFAYFKYGENEIS